MRIQYFLLVLVLIRNLRCFKHNQSSFVSMQRGAVQGNVPAERSYPNTKRMGKVMLHILVFLSAICGTGVFMDKAVKAVDFPATILHSSHVNVMPTEDFWYPPYTIGSWDTELIFKGAKFTDKVTIEELTTGDAIPGFKKYSVFFVPNVGMDASRMARRYVQLDSHPREDHSHNIRQLVAAFSPETVVDSAAYSYQSSTALFNSPGNVWNIKYHDKDGEGDIELRTTKRNIDVYAGTLETTEHFSQVKQFVDDFVPI